MGRKSKETTKEERKIIVNMANKGHSYKFIAETMNRPVTTVKTIVYRYKITGQYENKERSGRPVIFTEREKSNIVKKNLKRSQTIGD